MKKFLFTILFGVIIASIFYGLARVNDYLGNIKKEKIALSVDTAIAISTIDTTKVLKLEPLKIKK